MIVRNLDDAKNGRRLVETPGWNSVRLLLKDDAMGFSFHITTIYEGAELPMHYRNHLESVYCIAGEGSIENQETGERFPIQPGVMYALDANDHHTLKVIEEFRCVCVFNPPLVGPEVHDESGVYPVIAVPPRPLT